MEIKINIYLNKLISKKYNGLLKVVTGMRRCGKPYLFNIFKNYLLADNNQIRRIKKMIRILFVCHGNICRSPMAEYLLKYKKTK